MMKIDTSVQNVLSLKLCPEYSRSCSIALNVINGPEIAAPDLAVVMFVGTAALMILCVLPTLYVCFLYLSENKQRLVPLTA
jgi:hypothetical protein